MTDVPERLAQGEQVEMDPFSFFQDQASRIRGLGGANESNRPEYAFHTPYAETGAGAIRFAAAFEGLEAQRGTLILRINEFHLGSQSSARQVGVAQVQLRDLIREGGTAYLGCEVQANHSYALLGAIHGDTEVSATKLTVTMEQCAPDAVTTRRSTRFAADDILTAPRIFSSDPPSLEAPVSQTCTPDQLTEEVFYQWSAKLGTGAVDVGRWEQVYVLQALHRYGVLEPGSSGLGLSAAGSLLARQVAAEGATVTVTAPEGEPGPGLVIADLADLPTDLGGYDFCWSTGDRALQGDFAVALKFVEDSLVCLKPGGVAVHMLRFDLDPQAVRSAGGGPLTVTATEAGRLALILISRGHQVAQLKLATAEALLDERTTESTTMFGLVVRKMGG